VPYQNNLNLDFLDEGKEYTATVYTDDSSLVTGTNVLIDLITVDSEFEMPINISPQKGMAIIFSEKLP